jgi:hypothetical protein
MNFSSYEGWNISLALEILIKNYEFKIKLKNEEKDTAQ